ncbi:MAG: type II secretion system protein GspD [Planctomycetota bacterium]|jgi:type II secretory pathway component GspD/PulD (secretin)
MNRQKQASLICWVFVLVICLMQTRTAQAVQGPPLAVGREDPFAEIPRPKKPPVSVKPVSSSYPVGEAPELFVETVTLKFLDAKNLKEAVDTMSSPYGNIATNPQNNSLIICDTREHLTKILAEIRKADRTPQQIMIEVVILDVLLGDDTEIGINWDILSDETYDISYRQNYTASRLRSTIENVETIGDATAFNTVGLGGDFSVISGTVRNVVHLIQQKRQAEILASPQVMLVSGRTASIEAVEELPYTEITDTGAGGASALTSTEFKLVGVKLNVSAILTDSNDILLTVDAEQNVATGVSDTEIPIVDTRKANTSLLLRDGQLVIFGGLRRQTKAKFVDQIPILGDIPIIGALFKNTNTVVKNSELVIFLSPHVYKDQAVPEDALKKYEEITEKSMLAFPYAGSADEEVPGGQTDQNTNK